MRIRQRGGSNRIDETKKEAEGGGIGQSWKKRNNEKGEKVKKKAGEREGT